MDIQKQKEERFRYNMELDELTITILSDVGLNAKDLNGQIIPREVFINNQKYEQMKPKILELKKLLSSSALTALHSNAKDKQRFPLLNLIRQILWTYNYEMKPIRKSDGYTKEGVKKYKRFFQIMKHVKPVSTL